MTWDLESFDMEGRPHLQLRRPKCEHGDTIALFDFDIEQVADVVAHAKGGDRGPSVELERPWSGGILCDSEFTDVAIAARRVPRRRSIR